MLWSADQSGIAIEMRLFVPKARVSRRRSSGCRCFRRPTPSSARPAAASTSARRRRAPARSTPTGTRRSRRCAGLHKQLYHVYIYIYRERERERGRERYTQIYLHLFIWLLRPIERELEPAARPEPLWDIIVCYHIYIYIHIETCILLYYSIL